MAFVLIAACILFLNIEITITSSVWTNRHYRSMRSAKHRHYHLRQQQKDHLPTLPLAEALTRKRFREDFPGLGPRYPMAVHRHQQTNRAQTAVAVNDRTAASVPRKLHTSITPIRATKRSSKTEEKNLLQTITGRRKCWFSHSQLCYIQQEIQRSQGNTKEKRKKKPGNFWITGRKRAVYQSYRLPEAGGTRIRGKPALKLLWQKIPLWKVHPHY